VANIVVHNVSDRDSTPGEARSIFLSGQMLRPGKSVEMDSTLVPRRLRDLHGTLLWFGELPPRLRRRRAEREEVSAVGGPMDVREARAHLEALEVRVLMELCERVVPALTFGISPAKVVLVARLGRALFSVSHTPDPQAFFWLRRWRTSGDLFVERE